MKPPLGLIIARKVGKEELYRIFNDPTFQEDIVRRTNQRVDVYCELAHPAYQQPPGTMSHVYDWMEYDQQEDRMKLMATVHLFKHPDGTIGASGKPDPYLLVVEGVPLYDP
jgi:hypothetical protein